MYNTIGILLSILAGALVMLGADSSNRYIALAGLVCGEIGVGLLVK